MTPTEWLDNAVNLITTPDPAAGSGLPIVLVGLTDKGIALVTSRDLTDEEKVLLKLPFEGEMLEFSDGEALALEQAPQKTFATSSAAILEASHRDEVLETLGISSAAWLQPLKLKVTGSQEEVALAAKRLSSLGLVYAYKFKDGAGQGKVCTLPSAGTRIHKSLGVLGCFVQYKEEKYALTAAHVLSSTAIKSKVKEASCSWGVVEKKVDLSKATQFNASPADAAAIAINGDPPGVQPTPGLITDGNSNPKPLSAQFIDQYGKQHGPKELMLYRCFVRVKSTTGKTWWLKEQFAVQELGATPGDSGSLAVDRSGKPLGLVVANVKGKFIKNPPAAPKSQFTVISPLSGVYAAFKWEAKYASVLTSP
jgi:hypothetical protein